MALVRAKSDEGLTLDPVAVAIRSSFDHARYGDHVEAANTLDQAAKGTNDRDLQAWLKVRLAEVTQPVDPAIAQKILLGAHKLNSNVLKPLGGVAYQKLSHSSMSRRPKLKSIIEIHFWRRLTGSTTRKNFWMTSCSIQNGRVNSKPRSTSLLG